MTDLDLCPGCGRRIADFDVDGCEHDDGQRYCGQHCPTGHPHARDCKCSGCYIPRV